MRKWKAASMLALVMTVGACGAQEAPLPPVEDAPILLKGGKWALTRTLTGYNTPTVTAEEYAAKVGKVSSETICIPVGADGRPDADALAGADGKDCHYSDASLRKGRIVAALACTSGKGTSKLVLEGNYTPETLTLGVSMTRVAGGAAVLRTTYDLTGKREGECASAGG